MATKPPSDHQVEAIKQIVAAGQYCYGDKPTISNAVLIALENRGWIRNNPVGDFVIRTDVTQFLPTAAGRRACQQSS